MTTEDPTYDNILTDLNPPKERKLDLRFNDSIEHNREVLKQLLPNATREQQQRIKAIGAKVIDAVTRIQMDYPDFLGTLAVAAAVFFLADEMSREGKSKRSVIEVLT